MSAPAPPPPPNGAVNPATHAPGAQHDSHQPHHIAEFGEVEHLQHIDSPARPSLEDALPVPPVSRRDRLALHERMSRLQRKCFHERHLHQYWHGETLYRTAGNRSIVPDELFLDLVIVGGIAAIGHELRENFHGWRDVEKFFLLFSAIIISWRNTVFVWNLWGVCGDLVDKIGIYVVFTSLTFIALGGHGAFHGGPGRYVSVAALTATTVPAISSAVFAWKEPLLNDGGGTHIIIQSLVITFSSVPYLIAACIDSDLTRRILFWAALVINLVVMHISPYIIKPILRCFVKPKQVAVVSRLAIAIELMVEKYDVLTMIVLGESVIGILFEGAAVVTAPGVILGELFGAAAASTAMLYSLQTLYNNVDAPIAKGGKHAIRYKKGNGLLWSQLHMPYHAALVLFATGLSIALRDVAVPPTPEKTADQLRAAAAFAARAGDPAASEGGGPQFAIMQRWLFSAGWGASIILSGLIGALHSAGPRGATKILRVKIRCVVATAVMVGMPFSKLKAKYFLAVYTVVLVTIALVEYVFVQMDKMGFFRSEATMFSSSTDEVAKALGFDDDDDDDDDDTSGNYSGDAPGIDMAMNTDPDAEAVVAEAQNGMENGGVDETGTGGTGTLQRGMSQALQQRLCKSHKKQLFAASSKKCQLDKDAGVGLGE